MMEKALKNYNEVDETGIMNTEKLTEYTLSNYQEALNKQVIHMDQGVCYNPEFRATKMMHDYPSRKLQIARSIFKGELEASEYSSNLIYQSLLSRQGERWQNFGESEEECTDAMILSRAMMQEKGYGKDIVSQLTTLLDSNNGHLYPTSEKLDKKWNRYIKTSEESTTYLMLDDSTYYNVANCSRELGEFLTSKGLEFYPEIKSTFVGWEYFAHGMVSEGEDYVKSYLDELEAKGIDTIITLSGQSQYVLDVFVKKLGLEYDFRIVNILELVDSLESDKSLYLYGGTFYTRYLRVEDRINKLVRNEVEEKTRNSIEFIPILEADKRINEVTMWQKPIGPEFMMYGFDERILGKIVDEGVEEINKGTQQLTVAFDPYNYVTLKERLGDKVVYFAELLK